MSLIAYWPLDGDANDVVGTRHGTVSGTGGSWVEGRFGQARQFNVNDDAIIIPHDPKVSAKIFGVSERASISFWYRADSWVNYGVILAKAFAGSWSNSTLGVWAYTGGIRFVLGSNVSSNPASSSQSIIYKPSLNVWTHFSAVVDGETMKLYANAELVTQRTVTTLTSGRSENTDALTIGPRYVGGVSGLRGALCDLKLYDHGLSKREVMDDYVGLLSRYPMTTQRTNKPSLPTAYFPLTVNANDTVTMNTPINTPTAEYAVVDEKGGIDISVASDVVNYGDQFDMGLDDFTISCWGYLRSATLSYIVSKARMAADVHRYAVGFDTNRMKVFMQGDTVATDVVYESPTTITLNQWNHFIWSFDRDGDVVMFLNGVEVGRVSILHWADVDFDSTFPFRIGSYSDDLLDPNYIVDGIFSDVTVLRQTATASDYPALARLDMVYSAVRHQRQGQVFGAQRLLEGGYFFDGIDDYVELDYRDFITNQYQGSMSLWVTPALATGRQCILYNDRQRDFALILADGVYKAGYFAGNAGWQTLIGPTPIVGKRTHLCISWDSVAGEFRFYVDGLLVASSNVVGGWTSVTNGNTCYLGNPITSAWESLTDYFQGIIEDVRVYGEPLPAEYVKSQAQTRLSIHDTGNFSVPNFVEQKRREGAWGDFYSVFAGNLWLGAYLDGTEVYVDGVLQATLNKGVVGSVPVVVGSLVSSNGKPIVTGSHRNGAVSQWAGTQFTFYVNRYTPIYCYVFSPHGDALVHIYRSDFPNTPVESKIVGKDDAWITTHAMTYGYVVESDIPICVYVNSDTALANIGDSRPLFPCTTRLFGTPSSSGWLVAAEDNTTIAVLRSDGTTFSATVNRGQAVNLPGTGTQYVGASDLVTASKPVAINAQADADGGEMSPYVSEAAFSTHFLLPNTAEFVILVGTEANATVTVLDAAGTVTQTLTVSGGTNGRPTKLKIAGTLLEGYWIICSAPMYAHMEVMPGDDETVLHGYTPVHRQSNGRTLDVSGRTFDVGLDEVVVDPSLLVWYPMYYDLKEEIRNAGTVFIDAQLEADGYYFNGSTSQVVIPQPPIDFSNNRWTITLWIKLLSDGMFLSPLSAGVDHFLRYAGGNLIFQYCEGGDLNNRSVTSPVTLGTWVHIAAQMDGNIVRLYLNGELKASSIETIPIAAWTGNWALGQRANGTYRTNCVINDLRVFDNALSPTAIRNIYRTGRVLRDGKVSLVGNTLSPSGRLIEA